MVLPLFSLELDLPFRSAYVLSELELREVENRGVTEDKNRGYRETSNRSFPWSGGHDGR